MENITWLELVQELQKCPQELLEQNIQIRWSSFDKSLKDLIPTIGFLDLITPTNPESRASNPEIALLIYPNTIETDKEYTFTITRKELRERAWKQFRRKLSDDQCDMLIDYAYDDMIDDARLEHYFGDDLEGPLFDIGIRKDTN